jgi:hypothetical protein
MESMRVVAALSIGNVHREWDMSVIGWEVLRFLKSVKGELVMKFKPREKGEKFRPTVTVYKAKMEYPPKWSLMVMNMRWFIRII